MAAYTRLSRPIRLAVIRRVDERCHVEHVLEAFGVERARVALAGAVEALEGGAVVTAVDRGAGLAEVAVRTGGHGWGGTVSLSARS